MEHSLSILLPVHNAQATLQRAVERILDLVGDLTDRFELVILDDGSTDHTAEVAHDLAMRYPQVDLVRHGSRRGWTETIRAGIERTSGRIVCIHEGRGHVNPADIRKLWQLRDDHSLVLARHGRSARESGFHMLRRDMIHTLEEGDLLTTPGHEVRLDRHDRAGAARRQPARPNFLAKLRQFALGE